MELRNYATGRKLAEAGVVSAFDMTVEASLTKLYWLLAQQLTVEEVRERLQWDERGELSRPDDPSGRRWRLKRQLI